jgi:hypothetical protein
MALLWEETVLSYTCGVPVTMGMVRKETEMGERERKAEASKTANAPCSGPISRGGMSRITSALDLSTPREPNDRSGLALNKDRARTERWCDGSIGRVDFGI